MKYHLSIIIPVLNEGKSVELLYTGLKNEFERMGKQIEIIYVDDGSTDRTAEIVQSLHKKDSCVKLIQFRKNFGKSAAYNAGFEYATGDIIITMDGDLQDEPSDLPKLLAKMDEGYDFVSGWKVGKYKWYNPKNLPSKIFNKLTSMLTGIGIHDIDCPMKVFKREVIEEINIYGELHRYVPVLAHKSGFRVGEVKIKHSPRQFGKSNFGTGRIIRGFLDLITVFFLTKYLKRPLHLFGYVGLILLFLGLIFGAFIAVARFVFGIIIVKFWFIMLAVLLIILGIQFISVGLIGEMMTYMHGKTHKGYSINRIIK